ncbi:MAG TPA: RDD family protein, partial [Acidimicrobiia bacterium]|nr:RDD family protein [Acidimicrobiia bacterium]
PTRGLWYIVGFVVWALLYLWLSIAIFGKTLGKTFMGVRVVDSDGSVALHGRQSLVRAVTYPLSFVVLGLGLLGILFGRERRAWHDHFAGTAVVYDWGSRTARLPTPLAAWLDRKGMEN